MMAAKDEEAAIRRAVTLAEARRLCNEWGYWCMYGKWGDRAGSKPRLNPAGWQNQYRPPPQWHPPEPRRAEADEQAGMAVQKAIVHLPLNPYRSILMAEFCLRPWLVPLKEGEVECVVSRKARVSIGAYDVTLQRALLALANVMRRRGLWCTQ